MPYPPRLWRCNINAATPGEQIVNTLWVQQDLASAAPFSTQQVADRVRDSWNKFILGGNDGSLAVQNMFAGTTDWTSIGAYKVDALGKSTEQAEATFGPLCVGSASNAMPPQIAVCMTTLTGAPGRSQRGRMFLGGLGRDQLTSAGRMTAVDSQRLSDSFAKFMIAVRSDALDPDEIRPVVVSPTKTQARKITQVSCGDLYDVIRSRRKSLREQRTLAVVDTV